jgi:hypothetical protein
MSEVPPLAGMTSAVMLSPLKEAQRSGKYKEQTRSSLDGSFPRYLRFHYSVVTQFV